MNKALIAAALGLQMLASIAHAADRSQLVLVTERVRTDDLDLSSAAGAQAMFWRIKSAAGVACEQTRSEALPLVAYEIARCRRATVAQAVRNLNAPLVTAAHAAWIGATSPRLAAR